MSLSDEPDALSTDELILEGIVVERKPEEEKKTIVDIGGVNVPVAPEKPIPLPPRPITKDPLWWAHHPYPIRIVKFLAGPQDQPEFGEAASWRVFGARKCVDEEEIVYTSKGAIRAKELIEGQEILGGRIIGLRSFEDEVYEIHIGHRFKFKANGEHPLFIRKRNLTPTYKRLHKRPAKEFWLPTEEIATNKPEVGRWYVKTLSETQFQFNEISIGKSLAKLIGYLMSDGTFSELQSVKFTNVNEGLLLDVAELAVIVGQEMGFTVKSYPKGNGKDLLFTGKHGINHSPLKDRLRELGVIDRTTFGKLQALKKDELIEFIKGYFNGDGCLSLTKDNGHLNPSVVFAIGMWERQADELQFMLWRLGIQSTIKKDQGRRAIKGCWEVCVADNGSIAKLLEVLEDRKYPKKFAVARLECRKNSRNPGTTQIQHNSDIEGTWLPITAITKIGRRRVVGWTTDPSNLVIGRLGLKTHNTGKSNISEAVGIRYIQGGGNIWDICSAVDAESLAWLDCLEESEPVYSPTGIKYANELRDGDVVLGGRVRNIHSFSDELYLTISSLGGIGVKTNGAHPFWARAYSTGTRPGGWKSASQMSKPRPKRRQAEFCSPNHFIFDTISIGKPMAKLLGYICSDGYWGERQSISFVNGNKNLLDEVEAIASELGLLVSRRVKKNQPLNGKDIIELIFKEYASSHKRLASIKTGLRQTIHELGLWDKKSLGGIQRLQDDELIEFIRGFFNGDGCLTLSEGFPVVYFSPGKNKRVADELQFILWRLNIRGRIRVQKGNFKSKFQYDLVIKPNAEVKKLLKLLEPTKYPKVFQHANTVLKREHRTSYGCTNSENGNWLSIHSRPINKTGKVIGFSTDTGEITCRLGMRTHNSPWVDKVVLIKGDECSIEPPPGALYQIRPISEIDPLTAPEEGRIYILVKKFFYDEEAYYTAMSYIVDRAVLKDEWTHISCIIVREAEQFLASALHTHKARNQNEAAAILARANSMLLHTGFAIILDSVREIEVLRSLREINSYAIQTAAGNMTFERKNYWIFKYIHPNVVRHLHPGQAVITSEKGTLGVLYAYLVPFHHVRGTSITRRFGLNNPHFDEAMVKKARATQKQSMSSWARVIDQPTHLKIVEMRQSGMSFEKIFNALQPDGPGESTIRRSYNQHKATPQQCGCT